MDALVAACVITIGIGCSARVVLDGDVCNTHGIWTRVLTDISLGPFAGVVSWAGQVSEAGLRCTSDPVAHLDLHRGLWVCLAALGLGITIWKRAYRSPIHKPSYTLSAPVNCVVVECLRDIANRYIDFAIVAACVVFAKEIGLRVASLTPQEFPIDLIKIIREHDKAADDSLTIRGFYKGLHIAKLDVFTERHGGSIGDFVDSELHAICLAV